MIKLLSALGLGDGEGNTSSMRVVFVLVVLAVLAPKIILAIKTSTDPEWSIEDMEMLGIAFGVKLVQNQQEKTETKETKPQ